MSNDVGHLVRDDGYVAGVCEGLGRRLGISPTLIRVLWLGAVLFFGTGILLYLLLWWIVPHRRQLAIEPAVWVRGAGGAHPPLQRTVNDRRLLGVCGGLARRYDVDPSLVRLAMVVLFVASAGLAIVAYAVGAVLMPGSPRLIRGAPHPVEL
jgi:phage shock protein C